MTSFVCVLFKPAPIMEQAISKAVYTPEWVEKLYQGIRRNFQAPFRFVCITDHPKDAFSRDIEVHPFVYKPHVGTWMSINEVLRPDLELGSAIMLGLDTIIKGDISGLGEHGAPFAMMHHPGFPDRALNGVTLFKDAGWLWEEYMRNPAKAVEESKYERWARHQGSEMLWWIKKTDFAWIDDVCPSVDIRSYKMERGLCPKADIVYFQGNYKPDTAQEGWARRNWV